VQIGGQLVAIEVSGSLRAAEARDKVTVSLNLSANLSDLQSKITPILRAQLNQDNRCGDRVSLEEAQLVPRPPASLLMAKIHYEKWGCAKVLGREVVKKLVGGNGVIQVGLTPRIDDSESVRLEAEVTSIEADGELREVLRSTPFGSVVREKIQRSIASAVEKSAAPPVSLGALQGFVRIRTAQFSQDRDLHLFLDLAADGQVSAEQAQSLLQGLKAAASVN